MAEEGTGTYGSWRWPAVALWSWHLRRLREMDGGTTCDPSGDFDGSFLQRVEFRSDLGKLGDRMPRSCSVRAIRLFLLGDRLSVRSSGKQSGVSNGVDACSGPRMARGRWHAAAYGDHLRSLHRTSPVRGYNPAQLAFYSGRSGRVKITEVAQKQLLLRINSGLKRVRPGSYQGVSENEAQPLNGPQDQALRRHRRGSGPPGSWAGGPWCCGPLGG